MISLPPLTQKQKSIFTLLFVFVVFIVIVGAFWIQKYYAQRHPIEQNYYTQEDQDEQKWRATLPQSPSELGDDTAVSQEFFPPMGVMFLEKEYTSDMVGTTTHPFTELADTLISCPENALIDRSSESGTYISYYTIILTPTCAYSTKQEDEFFVLERLGFGEPESLKQHVGNYGIYNEYGGKLFFNNETVSNNPDSFKGSDEVCAFYAVEDGKILIKSTKTEIPETFCYSSDVMGLESFRNEYYTLFLYRGEKKSYILADSRVNLNSNSESTAFYIVQLNELNPQFLVLLGSSTRSFVFADKTQVVLVEIDPDYDSPSFSIEAKELPNADPNTLIVLNDTYIKDASTVFYDGVKMDGADAKTFEVLGPRYARDKNIIYFKGRSVPGADVKSFEVVGDYAGGFESPSHSVARDNNWYWYEAQPIFSIPKDSTLYTYKRIDWTDPNTYFSDDSYLYAYSPEATLKTKIPADILQSAEVKLLPGNVKHVLNYLLYLQCSPSPSLTYTSSTDYMTQIPIAVAEEEISSFCKLCTRCDRN